MQKVQKLKISVIGLGYVGLPLMFELSKKFNTVGFDINQNRIIQLKNGHDETGMLVNKSLHRIKKRVTSDERKIHDSNVYIITVPTPITKGKAPDLKPIKSATNLVSKFLEKGDLVIYESTVYPGLTEEECVPLLEKSGLEYLIDFNCGYSPERINPGDKKRTIRKIKKIVSASSKESLKVVKNIYSQIIDAGIYEAPSIKVAEAAKVIENTQRDVNIALINEFSILFNQLGIPSHEVLKAAKTKWNFLPFEPGLVGGHCIGVDPYYLTFQAQKNGYNPELTLAGRKINDSMHLKIRDRIIKKIKRNKIKNPKVLILGITFKENCNDLRNSKNIDLLKSFSKFNLVYSDPYIEKKLDNVKGNFKIFSKLITAKDKYDVIIITLPHEDFITSRAKIKKILSPKGMIFDVKNKIFKAGKNIETL